MEVWIKGEGRLTLGPGDFVGQGGQGAVYAKGSRAFKLYADPAAMPPPGKIAELAAIAHPGVVKPEKVVVDKAGRPLGYTMPFISGAHVLCRLFTRSFRERNGLTPAMVQELVQKLREGLSAVHRAGVLAADLNEMNFLVNKDFSGIYFIDVDSYQTPHYPATAVMDSIRDRHARGFSELSDWFSFAVVSFQMFTGVHPYKGKHPSVQGLEKRMQANISVLNPEVRVPKSAYPLDVIPPAYRAWYEAVLERGRRLPPPAGPGEALAPAPRVKVVSGGKALRVEELMAFDSELIALWAQNGRMAALTRTGFRLDGRRIPYKGRKAGTAFTPRMGRPVAAVLEDGKIRCMDLASGVSIPLDMEAETLMSYGGRVYFKIRDKVVELVLHEMGSQVLASGRVAARVAEFASGLFEGVAIQALPGSTLATFFPQAGVSRQVLLPELTGRRIVDALFDRGVLMAVAEKHERYDRFIFRFDPDYAQYDIRVVEDVPLAGLNFVCLESGVCVCLTEEEDLELFSARMGDASVKRIQDDVLGGDMKLFRQGGRLLFARGERLYSMSMR